MHTKIKGTRNQSMRSAKTIGAFLLTVIGSKISSAQVNTEVLKKEAIPVQVVYEGNLKKAIRWRDCIGDNIVVFSATDSSQTTNKPDGYREQTLHSCHYLLLGDSARLVWKLRDRRKACSNGLIVHFIDSACTITDLDSDGTAEVWLMYVIACKRKEPVLGSFESLKIIAFEGGQKYAARGDVSEILPAEMEMHRGLCISGAMDFKGFANAPSSFEKHAQELWMQNQIVIGQ